MTKITHIDNTVGNAIDTLKATLNTYENQECVASITTIITKNGSIINSTIGEWRTHAFSLLVANEINNDKLKATIKEHMKEIVL